MKPTHLLLAIGILAGTLAPTIAAIRLTDTTASSGITFTHSDGGTGHRHIMETVASGLALIDYDGDGYQDIYFLTGGPLDQASDFPTPKNQLYRNQRDGTFKDVTEQTGAGLSGFSLGCTVADYDNDGDDDVFVTGYGKHHLLRNDDGVFSDVTASAGLEEAAAGPECVGAGAAFLDYNRDGHLDLYIGNYLRINPAEAKPCTRGAIPVYCDPRTYPPLPDRLYRGRGNGTFENVSAAAGIDRFKGYTMGIVCSDFDGDGWADIFVGNDVQENFFFHNQQDGTFKEIGLLAGVAYDQYGDEQGTMGVNVADYDGDGLFDIIVTTYQNQVNTLYRNLGVLQGQLQFQDVTVQTGAGAGSLPRVTWGCSFGDFDNDGTRELFIAAGHLQDTIESYDQSSTYRQRNQLLQWRSPRFADITGASGSALAVVESSRGSVLGDLNNDGRLDLVVLNARTRPTIALNETVHTNHWTILKLTGTGSNRSAVGALARLTAGGRTQIDEVRAGRSYQSAEDLRLHFGLGLHQRIEKLEVRWPNGNTQAWTNLPVDRILHLTEGEPLPMPKEASLRKPASN